MLLVYGSCREVLFSFNVDFATLVRVSSAPFSRPRLLWCYV